MEGYTIDQAAAALDVSTKTVHNYLKNGLLRGQKVKGVWNIDLESIRNIPLKKQLHLEEISSNTTEKISIDIQRYEGLLTRLGQLEAEQQRMIEYKGIIDDKNRVIEEKNEEIKSLQSKLDAELNKSWIKRLFRK